MLEEALENVSMLEKRCGSLGVPQKSGCLSKPRVIKSCQRKDVLISSQLAVGWTKYVPLICESVAPKQKDRPPRQGRWWRKLFLQGETLEGHLHMLGTMKDDRNDVTFGLWLRKLNVIIGLDLCRPIVN
ncbi:hypothetical protein WN48_09911 [Eufriesea mexicana]|nr:hypothetical protein WN48_09911 [Eufriesea mexicana]